MRSKLPIDHRHPPGIQSEGKLRKTGTWGLFEELLQKEKTKIQDDTQYKSSCNKDPVCVDGNPDME